MIFPRFTDIEINTLYKTEDAVNSNIIFHINVICKTISITLKIIFINLKFVSERFFFFMKSKFYL